MGGVSRLIIGYSGSGKTALVKKLCERERKNGDRKFYAVNGDVADYPEPQFTHLLAENIPAGLENCTLVYEDLCLPSTKETRFLRRLLTTVKRHNSVTVFVVSHSVTGNNVASLVSQFDMIIFTNSLATETHWFEFCRRHARMDDGKAAAEWETLRKSKSRFTYLCYDNKTREMSLLDGEGREVVEPDERKRHIRDFISEFSHAEVKSEALRFWDYMSRFIVDIDEVIDKKYCIYNVSLTDGRTGRTRDVVYNLLDFLHDVARTTEPTVESQACFVALDKLINLPRCIVKNPLFLKLK